MKVLVTGSNGFIGSFLVERLHSEGHQVRCLVRRTSNLQWIKHLDVEFVYGELCNPATLITALREIDLVYHVGGVTRGRTEADYMKGNYTATVNLLTACEKVGSDAQKFVFVSSQAAGGPSSHGEPLSEIEAQHPISIYGRSKHLAEQAVMEFAKNRPATIVRPPTVYGPRDTDFYKLFRNARYGFMPVAGNGSQKISIIHVADLIEGFILAGLKDVANGQLFFLNSDDQINYNELARLIAQATGSKERIVHVPLGLVKLVFWGAGFTAAFSKKPSIINRDKFKEMKQVAWLCSNQKAKDLLDFHPQIGIEEGLKNTAQWYMQEGWL
ncbi:NAD(P)-dependent oxidoreductase [candidate division KSB1 bacterium]|nr:NAD(P)-dependent oxidoreductase [candidate division KSB1 bacterium]